MKMIHEIRRQQTWASQKRANPLPIVLGALIAFGIGALGVSGIVRTPTLLYAKTHMVPDALARTLDTSAIDTTTKRIGSPEAAPLLKSCVPLIETADAGHDEVFRMLQSVGGISRVAVLAGIKQQVVDDTQFATLWGQIADCIYRQGGASLCNPDNRAFAVEAASAFIRQLATAEKLAPLVDNRSPRPFGVSGDHRAVALRNATAIKERVLSGIRAQVSEGRLTGADFGMMVPSEISRVVREATATHDSCHARG
jgi:hypothetical protein